MPDCCEHMFSGLWNLGETSGHVQASPTPRHSARAPLSLSHRSTFYSSNKSFGLTPGGLSPLFKGLRVNVKVVYRSIFMLFVKDYFYQCKSRYKPVSLNRHIFADGNCETRMKVPKTVADTSLTLEHA